MADRGKVIRGLELCAYDPDPGQELKEIRSCPECPYYRAGCFPQLIRDALAMLKEQEARVLDWNEIGTVDDAVWLEDRDENEVVLGLVMQMHSAVNLNIKKGGKLHSASSSRSDYGERWRAWSSRPTPEQMRDTKWENDNETM